MTKIIVTYFRRGKAFIWKRKGAECWQNTRRLRAGVSIAAHATDREESAGSFLNSQKTTGS